MPRGNGTGPAGRGRGAGRGRPQDSGRGRMGGNRPGSGPSGQCLCPQCGNKVQHQAGVPCYDLTCPACGAKMARE
ncbi:MAG: hypothetical protein U5R06_11880 [candidate division KSB1 bacterium]|nr:hypothetical protein [candidate division KSB1 bacterium]